MFRRSLGLSLLLAVMGKIYLRCAYLFTDVNRYKAISHCLKERSVILSITVTRELNKLICLESIVSSGGGEMTNLTNDHLQQDC
jgi:hypothetical protein